jgi:hypothetical protein
MASPYLEDDDSYCHHPSSQSSETAVKNLRVYSALTRMIQLPTKARMDNKLTQKLVDRFCRR